MFNFKFEHNSDISTQRDTIFIKNLPKTITEDEIIIEKFGSIGIIKKDTLLTSNNKLCWVICQFSGFKDSLRPKNSR